MKRLPNNFRPALDEVKKKFDHKLSSQSDLSYNKINSLYNSVNKVFETHECEVFDINNVLHHYHIDNEYLNVVNNMRKLIIVRNKEIIKTLYKSKKLLPFLKELKYEMDGIFTTYVSSYDIESALLHVMKRYTDNWLGYWSLVNINTNGSIKDLSLFDKDDRNKFINFLIYSKKYKLRKKHV